MLNKIKFSNILLSLSVYCAIALILFGLGALFIDIFIHGLPGLNLDFLITEPRSSGRKGGIFPILISTLYILGICLAVSLPLSLGTAIFLAEYCRKLNLFSRCARVSIDVLAGVPSIVFGLFGNAFFCKTLGMGFSILSGGLTLACMCLPILIRTIEAGFRSLPSEYRLQASALGFSQSATLWHILIPAALPSVALGFILGVGRALAETAALIFTSGYVDRLPSSIMDSGRSLSIHIYDLAMNIPGGNNNAYSTCLVLILLLLIINSIAIIFSKRGNFNRQTL